jgi:hypothetical protein
MFMSNKSGTSDQVISLPKGGSALSGIGETFSPDLHTGTGNFTVPIALPPGRNGFQQDVDNDYWQVRSKDGLVSLYGTEAARENDPAVVAEKRRRGIRERLLVPNQCETSLEETTNGQ